MNLLFDPFLHHASNGDEGPSLSIFRIFDMLKIFPYYYYCYFLYLRPFTPWHWTFPKCSVFYIICLKWKKCLVTINFISLLKHRFKVLSFCHLTFLAHSRQKLYGIRTDWVSCYRYLILDIQCLAKSNFKIVFYFSFIRHYRVNTTYIIYIRRRYENVYMLWKMHGLCILLKAVNKQTYI